MVKKSAHAWKIAQMDVPAQIMNAKSEPPLPPPRKPPLPYRPLQLLLELPQQPNLPNHLPPRKTPLQQLQQLLQPPQRLQRPRQVQQQLPRLISTQVNVIQSVMKNFMHVLVHAVVTPAARQNVVKLTLLA